MSDQRIGETTEQRRARLDEITARIAKKEHTDADVVWLRDVVEEYVSAWEQTLGRVRRRSQAKRSTRW